MKLIVDSSTYSTPLLREYLAASRNHFAILTDYVAMEAYRATNLDPVFRAAETIAEYSKQVMVLKDTRTVCGLAGRQAGLIRRMIDELQTNELRKYCKRTAQAKRGNTGFKAQLMEKRVAALAHLDRMLGDTREFSGALELVASEFTESELRNIRKEQPYSLEFSRKVQAGILRVTEHLHMGHPSVHRFPPAEEVTNTFLFRTAVCAYALVIDWARVGGSSKVHPEKIRNDAVDIQFAAYATYFDGLLSADQKQQRIYAEAQVMMKSLFGLVTSER